jgi:hypothetical protein
MELLVIAVILVGGAYFGYQYYLAKKATLEPLKDEVVKAVKKVDVQVVLDVNKDGKVDMADATIIADTAKKAAETVKKAVKKPAAKKAPAKKPAAKKKPTMKIVK